MIELANIRIPVARAERGDELDVIRREAAKLLGVRPGQLHDVELRHRAIDARGGEVRLVCTVRCVLADEQRVVARALRARRKPKLRILAPEEIEDGYAWPEPVVRDGSAPGGRPVVIGAGCAGLFCALALAHAGLEPLLVERGDDATRRTRAVRHFEQTGELDPESNVQFGLGGAGTFSDGKLATGTKSAAHRLILRALAQAGAAGRILYDAKPHVGSDVLPGVVTELLAQIQALGGEVRLRTRLSDLEVVGGALRSVTLMHEGAEERVATQQLVLACGHSARDVYDLLLARHVAMERKAFAMGVRIEHPQALIDQAQYGRRAGSPVLGAAPYKLVEHLSNDRSCYSFCMCPGGSVMAAASEPGGVVTNGMSLAARAGANANAGLLVNVNPADLPSDAVLAGVDLQRRCERAAFELGGGGYVAPAQLVGDFLQGVPSSAAGDVVPTYPRGVAFGTLEGCLPAYILEGMAEAIPRMNRRIAGYNLADAVLTGVESRSSSPVRVTRGPNLESVSTRGLYPCGEGAGYAGGIMSAATDGLRVAEALIATYRA